MSVSAAGKTRSLLFDAGGSPDGLVFNLERLELDPRLFSAIALGRGHWDHHGYPEGVRGPRGVPPRPQRLCRAHRPVVNALVKLEPALLVPAHCSGVRAGQAIAQALPDAFVHNTVGTRYTLDAPDQQKPERLPDEIGAVDASGSGT